MSVFSNMHCCMAALMSCRFGVVTSVRADEHGGRPDVDHLLQGLKPSNSADFFFDHSRPDRADAVPTTLIEHFN